MSEINEEKLEEMHKTLLDSDEDGLGELRLWLFKESCRLEGRERQLDEMKQRLEHERETLLEEHNREMAKLDRERESLWEKDDLAEQKLDMLRDAYDRLDIDRQKMDRERKHTIVRDVNMESFNCLLMVKDFGATGFNICEDYMTNADVPYLATTGIIENPVNPFTGNALTMDGKTDYPMLIYDSEDWNVGGADTIAAGDAITFSEGDWYAFNGTRIFNRESWEFDGTR